MLTHLARQATSHAIHDIVRISSGSRLIITGLNPNRPANKYTGIKENGYGKEYVFGDKHQPVRVGHADSTHPALLALEARKNGKASDAAANAGGLALTEGEKYLFAKMVRAVLAGDLGQAKMVAESFAEAGLLD